MHKHKNKKPDLLQYYLDPYEGAIGFQIVKQDNEVTDFLKRKGVFNASNGWRIITDYDPHIFADKKVICLRGKDHTKDLKIARVKGINGNKERDKMINSIHKALEDLSSAIVKSRSRKPLPDYKEIVVVMADLELLCPEARKDRRVIII